MYIKDREMTVLNTVRQARTAKKMTQDELASQINATRQTVIAIEKGNYVPSILLALKLASVLNKQVEELFSYEKK